MRRLTHLTSAFFKHVTNHVRSLATYLEEYNFIRLYESLRIIPAMAAGLTTQLIETIGPVAMVGACHEREAKRPKLVAISS